MDYKELATLYHMDTSPDRDAHAKVELTSRLQADSTFRIGYQAKEGELFIATPRELSILDERVLRTERKVSRLMRSIPGIAQSAMLRGLVLDEVISTNAIESIHSTRRQIKNALESSTGSSTSQRKFRELARLYMDIIDGNSELPQTPADIRAIYDRGMDAEISNRDKPDGILFRAGGVDISNGMKTLHKGLEPEEKIAEAIEAMLKLAASEEIPSVYSAIASHYLFEYAHPFYDGNGRTGRYLLALYLSIPLSMATSLSLSRTIYENKKVYYRAFETAQNPLNRGELTHFVYSILELINIAQGNMATRLESARGGLDTLRGKLRDIASAEALESKERDALFMLMQYEMFGFFGDASLGEISAHLQRGEQRTRQYMKSLEEKGLVKRIRKRNPVTFALTDSFKQRYAIAPLETESAALNAAQGSE